MPIIIRTFKGEQPRIDPKKLPNGYAVEARNCSFSSGSLESSADLGAPVDSFTGTFQSFYRHPYISSAWRLFGFDADLLRGALANDAWDRVYWTGDSYPRYSTSEQGNTSSLRLGIPAPASPPLPNTPTGTATEGAPEIDCSYYCTYVSRYGEEGPPSQQSATIVRQDGLTIPLTGLPGQIGGEYNIEKIRIYRTEGDGYFNHVVDLPVAASGYNDSVTSENLAGPCPSETWLAPNSQLKGLTYLGNGVYAGFFKNTLAFCEPYFPHAWPPEYQLAFSENVVGIANSAAGLIVATKAEPWVVSGAHPSSMSQTKLDSPYPCVAKRSMVDMGDYVIYASHEGLVAAAGGEARLITSEILSEEDFQALNPTSFKAYRWDELYLAITDTGIFTYGPKEGIKHYDIQANAAWFDSSSSKFYVIKSNGEICEFGAGASMLAKWKSGIIKLERQLLPSCIKVDLDSNAIISLFADGQLWRTFTVASNDVIRLPAGRAKEFQFQIQTSDAVHAIGFASSPSELVDV